jgi:hypothetical protein
LYSSSAGNPSVKESCLFLNPDPGRYVSRLLLVVSGPVRGERSYNALMCSLKVMEDRSKEAFREPDETKQSVETGGRATGRDQSGVD